MLCLFFLKEYWKIGKCDPDQIFILKLVSIFPWPAIKKLATVTVFIVVRLILQF